MNKQVAERNYPSNWEIVPLASVAMQGPNSFVDGPFGSDLKVNDYTESGVRVLQLQNLGDGQFVNDNVIFTSEKKAQQLQRCIAKPGDIIIAKMADPLARAAIVPTIEERYLIVADLIKLRVDGENDARYVKYFINFADFRREAERLSTGTTRTRISLTTLKSIDLPKPPEWEQKKIADILTTVDNLIEQTEAAIHKYQAIKQGMMQDLFSRGIDIATGGLRPPRQEAPELYKPSPFSKFIPNTWRVISVGDIFEIQLGKMLSKAAKTGKSPYSYLANRNVQWGYVSLSSVDTMDFAEHERQKYSLVPGDLLVCEGGEIGRTAIWEGEIENCYYQKAIHRLRPLADDVLPKYMLYYMYMAASHNWLRRYTAQTSITHLPREKFMIVPLLLPTPYEQAQIVHRLETLEQKIRLEKDYSNFLNYVRQGLMQDLLTGKVRVKLDDTDVKDE